MAKTYTLRVHPLDSSKTSEQDIKEGKDCAGYKLTNPERDGEREYVIDFSCMED